MDFLGINKKNLLLWTLYDFANSIVIVAFFLYFSQWLVVDMGVSDIWYNLIFVVSTILLVLTVPVAAAIGDKSSLRMPFLNVSTVLMFIACLAASLLATLGTTAATVAIVGGILYVLGNYFYQFSLTFYNALLITIAPESKQGFISGLGQAGNWLGQIAGILISLPFVNSVFYLFGRHDRTQALVPATLVFFLLALPLMFFFKDSRPQTTQKISIRQEYKNLLTGFIDLCKLPGVGRYLLSFFLFNDAVLTLQNNFPIVLEQIFHASDTKKSLLLLSILITAAIGAFVSGLVADKIGLKKSLLIILVFWILLFPAIGLAPTFGLVSVVTVIMGFIYGSTWTITRAIMVYLVPKERINQAFSYYSLAERFSSFLGPIVWGVITTSLVHSGPVRYRIAAISMTVFIIAGFFIVKNIPSGRTV